MMHDVSFVIPAQNEADTIEQVIREIQQLHPKEIIVVVNGSTDQTAELCRKLACRVIEFKDALGQDIGRAVGARHAQSNIVVFTDGDIVIPSGLLRGFVRAIQQGHDVALNRLNHMLSAPGRLHYTTLAKAVVNRMLQRPDLMANSLLAVPHALSRKAIETIGWRNLAFPVVAQAIAIQKGLSITSPVFVDVINSNKPRVMHVRKQRAPFPESTERIIGDHLEALHYWTSLHGPRGGLTDGKRQRHVLQSYTVPKPSQRRARRSAIIPVGEEQATIREVIVQARLAGADEIIVVANGADPLTIQRAREAGAQVLVFAQRLGHNVGRAIGAAHSTGDALLFIDGDIVIPAQQLTPFFEAVEHDLDVALNDLTSLMQQDKLVDPISNVKYFFNCCLLRPDLDNGSLTAVPHAVHRRVLEKIGIRALALPPLALLRIVQANFRIANVHYVDVITTNRNRQEHQLEGGRIIAFERIIGDHLEALHLLLAMTDRRGRFYDGQRRRKFLEMLGD